MLPQPVGCQKSIGRCPALDLIGHIAAQILDLAAAWSGVGRGRVHLSPSLADGTSDGEDDHTGQATHDGAIDADELQIGPEQKFELV
jgi:hypothetical protein